MLGKNLCLPDSLVLVVCGRSSVGSSLYILGPLSCALYVVRYSQIIPWSDLIIYVRVDVKPISVIGFAHQLQLDDISRGFQNDSIAHTPPAGLLAFISKYLIDVSFLEETRAQGPILPTFTPPVPPDIPPVPPACTVSVRDADVSRVSLAAHNIPGYDVEPLELRAMKGKAPRREEYPNSEV